MKALSVAPQAIAASVITLFNQCQHNCKMSSDWKMANVTPVLKGGNAELLPNYCPISVVSILAKMFEGIICAPFQDYLSYHDILCDNQFGFRAGYST